MDSWGPWAETGCTRASTPLGPPELSQRPCPPWLVAGKNRRPPVATPPRFSVPPSLEVAVDSSEVPASAATAIWHTGATKKQELGEEARRGDTRL